MMVDGAEEGLFRGPIDVLAPYSSIAGHIRHLLQLLTRT
jgi:hypothetical protein